jgi:hypothetical protein
VALKAVLLLALSAVAWESLDAQTRLPDRDLPTSMRSVLGLELNRDSLASIVSRLGEATVWSDGTGHDSIVKWCYRVGDAVIEFGSEPEFGGAGRRLHEITLRRGPSRPADRERCTAVRRRELRTPAGVGLGSRIADFERVLGDPTRDSGESVEWEFSTTEPLAPSAPEYAHWNARRIECFDGKAPYVNVGVLVRVSFASNVAREVLLSRFNDAIC